MHSDLAVLARSTSAAVPGTSFEPTSILLKCCWQHVDICYMLIAYLFDTDCERFPALNLLVWAADGPGPV